MLNVKDVAALIEPILSTKLHAIGLDTLATRAELDHDGDPAIIVDATYGPNAPIFDAEIFLAAVNEAMSALADKGDDRFVYVRNFYTDGEAALDDSARRRRGKKGKAA